MRTWAMVALALSLTLSGCGGAAGPPVRVAASDVEKTIYFSSELSGKRVSIDGYINFDNGRNGDAIAMGPELRSSPYGTGDKLIGFAAKYGEGPNQINLHPLSKETIPGFPGAPPITTFDLEKVTYQDKAGASHRLNEQVRVTGRLDYARVTNVGLMSDEDSRSPTGRRFKPRLVDVVLEPAS